MPHFPIRLVPTVDVNRTETLNEAAISSANLIRYLRDDAGNSLIQKGGGWMRWFGSALPSICRALWGWQDINGGQWLAAGCEETVSDGGPLMALTTSTSQTITPRVDDDNVAVDATTTINTNIVEIGDTGSNITSFDSVFIQTHISIGGVILFGFYRCILVSADAFEIALYDDDGNPILATASVANAGDIENFSTTSGENVVEVELPDHGLAVGDNYPILIQTTVGGVVLQGDYIVQTVPTADTFTILAPQSASSTVSNQDINSGNARYDFYLGFGALPAGSGFGIGGFGIGGFGSGITPTANQGDPIPANDWTLDNWGSLLIACPTRTTFGSPDGTSEIGGPIFYWDPLGSTPTAVAIAEGPVANAGAFVAMPQRQIIAWGSTFDGVQDPLLIRGCDADNFFSWIATPTNLAFSRRLSTGSKIVRGAQMAQQLVFITDVGLWTGQFIGGVDVYSWNEVATGCGCVARMAAATLHEALYWMSQEQFFVFSGAGLQPLECTVWDAVFQNINKDYIQNVLCAANSFYNEITWYFPSNASEDGENDMCVTLNIVTKGWALSKNSDGTRIGRSAWINQTVLGAPIGTDPATNLILQHETSNDADGQPMTPFFQTGYAVLSEADVLMFIDQFWPDMKWGQYGSSPNATLQLEFLVTEYPGDDPVVYGPYTLTKEVQFITPRFRGRLVSLRFSSNDAGTFWRLGLPRYRGQPDGKFL